MLSRLNFFLFTVFQAQNFNTKIWIVFLTLVQSRRKACVVNPNYHCDVVRCNQARLFIMYHIRLWHLKASARLHS